jgi:D-lactate dehydrogenase
MRAVFYSLKSYERPFLEDCLREDLRECSLLDVRLSVETARLAEGFQAISIFANDDGSAETLRALHALGVRCLALRSAGFNHVDIGEAERLGLRVARVPAYSPHAVAEHTLALILTLNRKTHRAYQRVREQNFSLEGLMGFDLYRKTVGIIGTGKIGQVTAQILRVFGCELLAYDPVPNDEVRALGVRYVPLSELWPPCDIVTVHCPLTPATHHLVNAEAIKRMKKGAMLINTSRGGVLDTKAVIVALKSGQLGGVGIDVYEEEGDLFFKDLSDKPVLDDTFVRLVTFPNVLITAHQGFLTREAVQAIERVTVENLRGFFSGRMLSENLVTSAKVKP